MTGFMGMGMVGNAMGGGFNAAQTFYNMGVQQQAAAPAAPAAEGWSAAAAPPPPVSSAPNAAARSPDLAAGGWKCKCGATATGKFCPECGSPKPADDGSWTCSCGQKNMGKFCANCGSKKPAGVPQYRCDKCGWQPADPTKAPRFCPECGDPFDNGDIV